MASTSAGVPCRDDGAAGEAGARAHVDEMIGGAHRLLVVLDDEDGVAEAFEAAERAEKARVVALMQPDRGLVEHVEHAGEAGADLAREPDALAFAARERGGAAGEGEVVEPDIDEELQALGDLAEDSPRDLQPLRGQRGADAREPVMRGADGKIRGLGDVLPADPDRQRLRLEARAVADGAGFLGLVAGELLAHPGAVGLGEAALEIADHALEGLAHRVGAHAVLVGEGDLLGAGAEEDGLARPFGKVLPGGPRADLEVAGEALQRLVVVGGLRAGPGRDGAAGEALALVRDDQLGVEEALGAEPVAGRAGAVRAVEAEEAWLDLGDGEAADGAGESAREDGALAARRVLGDDDAVGEAERGFEAVGEAGLDPGMDDDAVHHRLDVVVHFAVEGRNLGNLVERAVHLGAGEALAGELGELLAVFALAAAHDRGEEEEPRAFRHGEHAIDHLAHGLRLDRQAGGGRIGNAGARPEQAHIVVDLGDGADRGARVVAGGLLLDRDRGREALDLIDVRLAGELEELAGVGGEALDVAALALGVDRVEGQRGFPRARDAGDDGELIARNGDIHVLEVVLAGTANVDEAGHRAPPKGE